MKSLVMAINAKTVVKSSLSTLHKQVFSFILIENHPDGVKKLQIAQQRPNLRCAVRNSIAFTCAL